MDLITTKSMLEIIGQQGPYYNQNSARKTWPTGTFTVTWCGRLNFSIALPPCAQVIGDFKESFDQTCAYDLLKFPNYYY